MRDRQSRPWRDSVASSALVAVTALLDVTVAVAFAASLPSHAEAVPTGGSIAVVSSDANPTTARVTMLADADGHAEESSFVLGIPVTDEYVMRGISAVGQDGQEWTPFLSSVSTDVGFDVSSEMGFVAVDDGWYLVRSKRSLGIVHVSGVPVEWHEVARDMSLSMVVSGSGGAFSEMAMAGSGDEVSYHVTMSLPPDIGNWESFPVTFHDSHDPYLSLVPGSARAVIDGQELELSVEDETQTELEMATEVPTGSKARAITLDYRMVADAGIAPGTHPSIVWGIYPDSHYIGGYGRTEEDGASVVSLGLVAVLDDGNGTPLPGASVVLGKVASTGEGIDWWDGSAFSGEASEAHGFESDADGRVGLPTLADGTYVICLPEAAEGLVPGSEDGIPEIELSYAGGDVEASVGDGGRVILVDGHTTEVSVPISAEGTNPVPDVEAGDVLGGVLGTWQGKAAVAGVAILVAGGAATLAVTVRHRGGADGRN